LGAPPAPASTGPRKIRLEVGGSNPVLQRFTKTRKGKLKMTHQDDNTTIGQMLEAVITQGMDGLETAISGTVYIF
jgi:hypothetical protein